jgi:threonine/homoserine/homoserine lactone efflux protein
MELMLLLKGLIIGFAMAIPIGPVGVLCIRKTLAEGHARGMFIGLGAATADSLYASMAAFGLTFISDAVTSNQFWVSLGGGSLLFYLGIRTFRSKKKKSIVLTSNKGLARSYASAFFLALTNPVTIFAFVAVFAAFGLGKNMNIVSASIIVFGVFTGSYLWFLTLSYIATHFRKKIDSGGLVWVNRIAGILIIVSGAVAFISLI